MDSVVILNYRITRHHLNELKVSESKQIHGAEEETQLREKAHEGEGDSQSEG